MHVQMKHRLATPLALLGAVAVFAGMFLLTESLLWSPVLAAVAATGIYLMLDDRTIIEVSDDQYDADADRKMRDALDIVREIRKLCRDTARIFWTSHAEQQMQERHIAKAVALDVLRLGVIRR